MNGDRQLTGCADMNLIDAMNTMKFRLECENCRRGFIVSYNADAPCQITGIQCVCGHSTLIQSAENLIGRITAGYAMSNLEPKSADQKPAHTPGPWKAASSASSIVGWPVVGPYGRAVASVHTLKGETDLGRQINGEAGANARLIAAAPDMYEALKAVVAIADRKTDEFDMAHAALLKAEGNGNG